MNGNSKLAIRDAENYDDVFPACWVEFPITDNLFARCHRPRGHSGIELDTHLNSDATTWYAK